MSRRDIISDFTRPSSRNTVRPHYRVDYSQRQTVSNKETGTIFENDKKMPTSKSDISRTHPKSPSVYSKQSRSNVLKRTGLKKPHDFKPKKQPKKFKVKTFASVISILLLVVVTPVLIYKNYNSNNGVVMGVKKLMQGTDSSPKYLIASSVMDVPAKVEIIDTIDDINRPYLDNNKIGWYKNSSKPGEPGVMVFAGHVTGADNTGALREVDVMKKGDYLYIETGDGRILPFIVQEVAKVQPQQINENMIKKSLNSEKSGLNIVTFTDENSSDTEKAKFRYIVYATQE